MKRSQPLRDLGRSLLSSGNSEQGKNNNNKNQGVGLEHEGPGV